MSEKLTEVERQKVLAASMDLRGDGLVFGSTLKQRYQRMPQWRCPMTSIAPVPPRYAGSWEPSTETAKQSGLY